MQTRVDELADKANEGLLTDAERVEYLSFIEAMDVIMIFLLRVRQRTSKSSARHPSKKSKRARKPSKR